MEQTFIPLGEPFTNLIKNCELFSLTAIPNQWNALSATFLQFQESITSQEPLVPGQDLSNRSWGLIVRSQSLLIADIKKILVKGKAICSQLTTHMPSCQLQLVVAFLNLGGTCHPYLEEAMRQVQGEFFSEGFFVHFPESSFSSVPVILIHP